MTTANPHTTVITLFTLADFIRLVVLFLAIVYVVRHLFQTAGAIFSTSGKVVKLGLSMTCLYVFFMCSTERLISGGYFIWRFFSQMTVDQWVNMVMEVGPRAWACLTTSVCRSICLERYQKEGLEAALTFITRVSP